MNIGAEQNTFYNEIKQNIKKQQEEGVRIYKINKIQVFELLDILPIQNMG